MLNPSDPNTTLIATAMAANHPEFHLLKAGDKVTVPGKRWRFLFRRSGIVHGFDNKNHTVWVDMDEDGSLQEFARDTVKEL